MGIEKYFQKNVNVIKKTFPFCINVNEKDRTKNSESKKKIDRLQ